MIPWGEEPVKQILKKKKTENSVDTSSEEEMEIDAENSAKKDMRRWKRYENGEKDWMRKYELSKGFFLPYKLKEEIMHIIHRKQLNTLVDNVHFINYSHW